VKELRLQFRGGQVLEIVGGESECSSWAFSFVCLTATIAALMTKNGISFGRDAIRAARRLSSGARAGTP